MAAAVKPLGSPEPLSLYQYQLPYELEREICELVAFNYPKCIPKLILTARRFKTWIEPELYRIIRSGEGRVIPPLYNNPPNADPSQSMSPVFLDLPRIETFGKYVQHVLLQKRTSQEIESILKCCPNVSNLALWIIHGTCTRLIPILESMNLLRFSFDPSYFFENYAHDFSIPFNQPVFRDLTHLEIINATSSWSKWKQLAQLPKLTHLALAGVVNQQLIDRVLEECLHLELFIMFYMNIGFLAGELTLPQKDHRVILLKSVADHLDHWEKGARGEEDFWITAEIQKEEAMQGKHLQNGTMRQNGATMWDPNSTSDV